MNLIMQINYIVWNFFLALTINCKCGSDSFEIQIDNSSKTSKVCFRCQNSKCRYKFNIRINSFFSKFSKIRLLTVNEVIKGMLCKDFNIEETHKYLTQDLHLIISIKAIREIYSAIRYVLYKYF